MRDYEPDVSQILALYQQLEDDIISSMTKRMLKMGKVSESTKYEAKILQSAGLLYEDILNLIAQRTDATKQHVKALFKDAGVQTVEIDNQIHTKAGAVPIAIRQDLGMKRILEAGYKKTLKTMRNLVNTTANMVQTAFISSCDRAYMQVSSGAFSYQQAIRQAVKSFADIGATVKYPSGHTDKLDVAVRRAVLTGVGQTSAMVAMERAKQADCYLMELTAHSGSRPEHAVWQGQLVSLTGKDVGKTIDGLHVFSLQQIGYQTGAGFKGWNCRHNWHPYYVGYSIPNYTKEQLAELDAKNIQYNGKMYSEYEISQMQRAKERKVRALKRQCVASQTALENAPDSAKAELQVDYSKNAIKLKSAEKQLREFCKQTERQNDTFRTQVDSFGRSEAQKAVWANKKAQDLSQSDSDFLSKFIAIFTDKKEKNY
ncbi:MAG: phage minor capsid protein, partial [Oscillospiraceae bacterium]|nr:phage minor capsid protein [Oscillospiraceae bacterium]